MDVMTVARQGFSNILETFIKAAMNACTLPRDGRRENILFEVLGFDNSNVNFEIYCIRIPLVLN